MPISDNPDIIETLHLDLGGGALRVDLRLPNRPCTLMDLIGPARQLSQTLTEAAVAVAASEGRRVSCHAGCGVCCRQFVGISVIEAHALGQLVATLPAQRRECIESRFSAALNRLEGAGLLDRQGARGDRAITLAGFSEPQAAARATSRAYFAQGIACPFLEAESCGIYAERSMMCREYHVSSPCDYCTRVHNQPVRKLTPVLHMGVPLARIAASLAGIRSGAVPFILALEWSAVHGHRLTAAQHEPRELLLRWLGTIDEQCATPFEARGGMTRGE